VVTAHHQTHLHHNDLGEAQPITTKIIHQRVSFLQMKRQRLILWTQRVVVAIVAQKIMTSLYP
jgi:hypothetical protein